MATFVLEIGSEELPARFLAAQENDMANSFATALNANAIEYRNLEVYSTPRRLILLLECVDPIQKEKEELILGPAVKIAFDGDKPSKALEGFLKSQEAKLEDLIRENTPKGEYVALRKRSGGVKSSQILAQICPEIIKSHVFPKRMHWGEHKLLWARPLHWILALLDNELISFSIDHLHTDRITYGHRLHGRGPFNIASADDLLEALATRGGIEVKAPNRRAKIIQEADNLAKEISGKILWKTSLLDEVQGLVEHPVPMLGKFDPDNLQMPREVLLTSMQTHQKSFGVEDERGNLLPYFLTVLNMTPPDLDLVRRGWERVLRARLADAKFFWQADLNDTFANWINKLDQAIFLRNLGTLADKSRRLQTICRELCKQIGENPDLGARAGELAKADLMSSMVGEFDSLQGIMGGIYAEQKGENHDVAKAIQEQYLPTGPESVLPQTKLGAILAIADKADTLAGCFGLGLVPTGAADPHSLRRSALGIIRICLDFDFQIDLRQLFASILDMYGQRPWKQAKEETVNNLLEFISVRLQNYWQGNGKETLTVEAVLACGVENISHVAKRLVALEQFLQKSDYIQALQTCKRVNSILRKQSSIEQIAEEWDANLLQEQAEKDLASVLNSVLPRMDKAYQEANFTEGLNSIYDLRTSLDNFFDSVMVISEDSKLRGNRLAMLKAISKRFAQLADFSLLQI